VIRNRIHPAPGHSAGCYIETAPRLHGAWIRCFTSVHKPVAGRIGFEKTAPISECRTRMADRHGSEPIFWGDRQTNEALNKFTARLWAPHRKGYCRWRTAADDRMIRLAVFWSQSTPKPAVAARQCASSIIDCLRWFCIFRRYAREDGSQNGIKKDANFQSESRSF